jgi:hypothetical protein
MMSPPTERHAAPGARRLLDRAGHLLQSRDAGQDWSGRLARKRITPAAARQDGAAGRSNGTLDLEGSGEPSMFARHEPY